MLIPSSAVALAWTLKTHGLPPHRILAALRVPQSPAQPTRIYFGWFRAYRDRTPLDGKGLAGDYKMTDDAAREAD